MSLYMDVGIRQSLHNAGDSSGASKHKFCAVYRYAFTLFSHTVDSGSGSGILYVREGADVGHQDGDCVDSAHILHSVRFR